MVCRRPGYARWVFAFVILTGVSFGTAGVAIRRSNALIVGTDSLFWTGDTPKLGCKIRHENGVFVATAGVSFSNGTGFDVYDWARRSAIKTGSAKKTAMEFVASAYDPFVRALGEIRADYPDYYKTRIKPMREPLQVVFFGFENKLPLFVFVYASIRDDPRLPIHISMHYKSCPGSACPLGEGGQLFGEVKAAERTFAMTPADVDDVETVRRMIEAEKVAHPLTVNGPTEVIVVDSKGFRWPHNDQHCE